MTCRDNADLEKKVMPSVYRRKKHKRKKIICLFSSVFFALGPIAKRLTVYKTEPITLWSTDLRRMTNWKAVKKIPRKSQITEENLPMARSEGVSTHGGAKGVEDIQIPQI